MLIIVGKFDIFIAQLLPTSVAFFLQVGDTVLLPEFGGAKIELEDKEYFLYKESELVAKIDG